MDAGEKGQVEGLIKTVVEVAGFEVFRLTIRPDRTVALVLDRDDRPITLDDCVLVNRKVRRALEDADVEVDDYSIDVESPGTDRPLLTLRHFERFTGERVRVVLHEPHAGNSYFVGIIAAVEDERISIELEGADPVRIPFIDIKSARLEPQLPF